ncbi:hypothetical protein HDU97_001452 [Phlyctochytrium planicorne]|nr:hypothetical protein HDU97_001452 [Phlyctochytrium planicorne]
MSKEEWQRHWKSYPSEVKKHALELKAVISLKRRLLPKLDAWIHQTLLPALAKMESPFLTKAELYRVIEYRSLRDDKTPQALESASKLSDEEVQGKTRAAFRIILQAKSTKLPLLEECGGKDLLEMEMPLWKAIAILRQPPKVPGDGTDGLGIQHINSSMALSILSLIDDSLPFFDDILYSAVMSEEGKRVEPKVAYCYSLKDLRTVIWKLQGKALALGWPVRKVAKACWAYEVATYRQLLESGELKAKRRRGRPAKEIKHAPLERDDDSEGLNEEISKEDGSRKRRRKSQSPY